MGMGGSQSTSTEIEIPRYLNKASKEAVRRAQALSREGYVPYSGSRLAEFSPEELDAFAKYRQQMESWQDRMDESYRLLRESQANWADKSQEYMNPYIRDVLDIAQQNLAKEQNRIMAREANRAIAAGGYWNPTFQALRAGTLNKSYLDSSGELQKKGLSDAYDRAYGAFNTDMMRKLQGAQAYRTTADADIARAMEAGLMQRQMEQTGLDIDYANWLEQRQWPYKQIEFLTGVTRGVPHGTTQTTSAAGGSPLQGGIGGALAGGMIGLSTGNPWLAGAGVLGGGLLGGMSGM